jgi:hypothetical protein
MPLDTYDASTPEPPDAAVDAARPYVGILFECCGIYVRVYRGLDEARYEARCPKCLRTASLRVARGGTDARFFRAS